jgi:hypothetical protein
MKQVRQYLVYFSELTSLQKLRGRALHGTARGAKETVNEYADEPMELFLEQQA